jgi:hypothetical protein
LFNLGNPTRNVLLNVAPPGRPDDPNQEPIEGRRRTMHPVIFSELHVCGEELLGAGYVHGGGSMRHRLCTQPGAVAASCNATAALYDTPITCARSMFSAASKFRQSSASRSIEPGPWTGLLPA